ncbi:MAG: hypothetical protein NTU43_02165 [Bacteroidetes bacterium]|nr:hypothetical protein [Bacteroidota bacterium]
MKKILFLFLFVHLLYTNYAQNISRSAISSAGAYFSNADINISSTLGETFTSTLNNNLILSQGFQQKAYVDLGIYFNIKLFIQGFYLGSNTMISSVNDPLALNIADSITLELHESFPPNSLAYSTFGLLHTNGTASILIPTMYVGNSYYIVVKHRNSIETWSSIPMIITSNGTNYDFTDSTSKAYGDNLIDLGDGNFAIYSGDISQDGSIDFNDYPALDISSTNGDLGYFESDLNGDTSVDFNDYPILDINSAWGVITILP